tara:strand:- start:316 stop:831 length:516 start_codon:yes stop_codon:yes gene_type:complete
MITIIENKFEKSEMEHLINIYEKYINHREIDKYGTEVINWFDLPDEIDDNTLFVSRILTQYAQIINNYTYFTGKNDLKVRHIHLEKHYNGNVKEWNNEKAWNRLNIHIPLNRAKGGTYNFVGSTVSPKPGYVIMFDGLENWWSIDPVNEGEKLYKLVIQYENMDPSLIYDE